MKVLEGSVLEDLELALRNRKINLNSKNRIHLDLVNNKNYLVKFHQPQEQKRVNDALTLQEIAHIDGFPCNLPLKNNSGFFTQEYEGGFITAYEYALGKQLDPSILWSKEVLFFVDSFFEFQKKYNGPKINYCRKGLGEQMNTPVFNSILLSRENRDSLEYLSTFDNEICQGNTIIHGDILPKNIIKSPENSLVLVDFEKVMRGTLTGEIASSVFYSYTGTDLSLKKVYDDFSNSIKNKLDIDFFDLKKAIAHKSGEYLIHRKINYFLGNSKEREVAKAERFFSEAIGLLESEHLNTKSNK